MDNISPEAFKEGLFFYFSNIDSFLTRRYIEIDWSFDVDDNKNHLSID